MPILSARRLPKSVSNEECFSEVFYYQLQPVQEFDFKTKRLATLHKKLTERFKAPTI